MPRIRLTGKGYDSFTSFMGTVEFKDGVSVDHVSKAEMNRLGALTAIEIVNDDGTSGGQGGSGVDSVNMRTVGAPVVSEMERGKDEDFPEVEPVEDVELGGAGTDEDEVGDELDAIEADIAESENAGATDEPKEGDEVVEGEDEPAKVYTRAELGEIADKSGMAGLREIGEHLDVRDTSIVGLIDKIIDKQDA